MKRATLLFGTAGAALIMAAQPAFAIGRGEALSNSPVTVSSFSSEDLAQGRQGIEDIVNLLPQLTPGQATPRQCEAGNSTAIRLRGIGNARRNDIFVDGLPAADRQNHGLFVDFVDVQRIEVESRTGAAGCWPEEATGGVINIITRAGYAGGRTDYRTANHGIGFRSTGSTEVLAGIADGRFYVDGYGIDLIMQRRFSNNWQLLANYTVLKGDSTALFSVPSGDGQNEGFVYDDFSPSGSTGINLGDNGLTGWNNARARTREVSIDFKRDVSNGFFLGTQARYQWNSFDTDSFASTEVFGFTFSQHRVQFFDRDLYDISLQAGWQAPDNSPFDFTIGAFAGIGGTNADLQVTTQNTCPLCPAADQNFTQNIFDEYDATHFRYGITGSISVDIVPDVGLFADGTWERVTNQPFVFNPGSGNDLFLDNRGTGLENDFVMSPRTFRLGVRFRF